MKKLWQEFNKSTTLLSLSVSIALSLGVTFLWHYSFLFNQELNIALAAYNLGWAVNQRLCEKFHSYENICKMHDVGVSRAIINMIFKIDAERVANGLKPISEIFEDGHGE